MKAAQFIFALLLLFPILGQTTECSTATVYFVPFDSEEVTPRFNNDNIRAVAAKVSTSDPVLISKLMSLLAHGTPHKFDFRMTTRAAIECGQSLFFVDLSGDVLRSKGGSTFLGKTYRINRAAFLEILGALRTSN